MKRQGNDSDSDNDNERLQFVKFQATLKRLAPSNFEKLACSPIFVIFSRIWFSFLVCVRDLSASGNQDGCEEADYDWRDGSCHNRGHAEGHHH